jgi:hypothetical protein
VQLIDYVSEEVTHKLKLTPEEVEGVHYATRYNINIIPYLKDEEEYNTGVIEAIRGGKNN